jgi:hypothetical protein
MGVFARRVEHPLDMPIMRTQLMRACIRKSRPAAAPIGQLIAVCHPSSLCFAFEPPVHAGGLFCALNEVDNLRFRVARNWRGRA